MVDGPLNKKIHMKIKFEVDVTPEEVLELFEGNTEALQKAMITYFLKSVPTSKGSEQDMFKFWQTMAEKSSEMFNSFQPSASAPSPKNKK